MVGGGSQVGWIGWGQGQEPEHYQHYLGGCQCLLTLFNIAIGNYIIREEATMRP